MAKTGQHSLAIGSLNRLKQIEIASKKTENIAVRRASSRGLPGRILDKGHKIMKVGESSLGAKKGERDGRRWTSNQWIGDLQTIGLDPDVASWCIIGSWRQ